MSNAYVRPGAGRHHPMIDGRSYEVEPGGVVVVPAGIPATSGACRS